jgi:surface antigen
MKKLIITSFSLSFLLISCTSMNNADVGTVGGGVVGGLIGSQFGGGAGRIAATGAGAIAGAFIGGQIGRTMDKVDRLEMQNALEKAPIGRAVSWRTYYTHHQPCREYTTHAVIDGHPQQIHGRACRQANGSWHTAN